MSEEQVLEDKKSYEVSFLVTEETVVADIEAVFIANGFTVSHKGQLQNLKLAYPIQKHVSAFFGFYHLLGGSQDILKVKEALALNKKILRTLVLSSAIPMVVRESRVEQRVKRTRGGDMQEKIENVVPMSMPKPEEQRRPMEPTVLSNEGLEKKLEEILK